MKQPTYKLVCWGDVAIPIPEKMRWMSFDKDGDIRVWKNKPVATRTYWDGNEGALFLGECDIPPPEPGPWDTQIYWIR